MSSRLARLLGYHRKEEEQVRIREILKAIPIFADLSRRELAAVERILHRREYQPDETIFHVDEPGMGMYIIEFGRVAIMSDPPPLSLVELSVGEFFGELPLLDDSPRSATAVAKTHCKLFGFFQPDLFALIERNPRLGVKIVRSMAAIIGMRLKIANSQIHAFRKELELKKAQSEQT